MRTCTIALAAGAFLLLVPACQPSPSPVEPKGREDVSTPGIVQPPKTYDLASQPPAAPSPAEPICQTPIEAVQSVFKSVPSATVRHLNQMQATSFIARFNAVTGDVMTGDEVLLITSLYYGNDIVTIFAKANCVLKTVAFEPAEPNHD